MSIVFPNFFTYFCDILHNYDTFPCIQLIFQPEPFAEYRGSSRTHVWLGAWFWSAKADIFFSESLHILAERLSQSEIVLPLRKTCYYSPLAEVGVFSTEIKIYNPLSQLISKQASTFKNAPAFLLRGARHAIAWHTSTAHLCNPAGGYIRWGIGSHHWY